ncbi:MAG: ABC transporter permease [Anaerolineae bacterium]|jgi:peptide/nickel transport system permease protein|nr:ABC transporter permease [Anaerolineae bacterium]MBT7072663.1 ABC transporter permease [Anaerolineae bacterium]MBT7324914.1 ABC transporter permease [Anaerolineae bacterium]
MLSFIGRRLAFIISVCVLIIFSVNLGMDMARNSSIEEPSYDLVNFSQKAWTDTRTYIEGALDGDLGYIDHDVLGTISIWELLKDTYTKSMGLLLTSLLIATFLGLSLGTFAALIKKQRVILALLILTILGVSTPSFFAGLLLQQGEMKYFQATGEQLVKMAGFGWDIQHMLMPILVLMARPLAYLTRASFLSLNRVMDENYIRTAYSKGLPNRWVVYIHALRNIAVPVLTSVGVSLRFSLSTLPVVEFFFAWPGVGLRLLESINARQTEVVVTLALALGLTLLLINLLLDIAYRIIDPRLREEEA